MALGYEAGGWEYRVGEDHIYGSSRIGVHQTNLLLRSRFDEGDISVTLEDVEYTSLYRGKRHYELSNHLGNVQVIVSDKRISVCDGELEVEYFKADVLAAMDYYPFGMMMPGRQWYFDQDTPAVAFGFNGMLADHEINGNHNSYDFESRIYNPRTGKFLSLDPLLEKFPYWSPYSYAINSPIRIIDGDGMGPEDPLVLRTNFGTYTVPEKSMTTYEDLMKELRDQAVNSKVESNRRFKPKVGTLRITLFIGFLLIPSNANYRGAGWCCGNEMCGQIESVSCEVGKQQLVEKGQMPLIIYADDPADLPDWYLDKVAERVQKGEAVGDDLCHYNEFLRRNITSINTPTQLLSVSTFDKNLQPRGKVAYAEQRSIVGSKKDAETILRNIAKTNGVEIDEVKLKSALEGGAAYVFKTKDGFTVNFHISRSPNGNSEPTIEFLSLNGSLQWKVRFKEK